MSCPMLVVRSGNLMATAAMESERRCLRRSEHWVVFPHLSTPSKSIKAPRFGLVFVDMEEEFLLGLPLLIIIIVAGLYIFCFLVLLLFHYTCVPYYRHCCSMLLMC